MVTDDDDDKNKKLGKEERKKLEEQFKEESQKYTKDDLDRLVNSGDKIEEKFTQVPKSVVRIVKQIKLLFNLLQDYRKGEYKQVPWSSISAIIFCIIYFLTPVDLIPDAILILGYIDDVYVIRLTLSFIHQDLVNYCEFKGIDLNTIIDKD